MFHAEAQRREENMIEIGKILVILSNIVME